MKEAITFSAFLAVALCATTVQAGAKTMPILGWHGIQPDQIPTATVRLAAVDLPTWVTSLETPDGGVVVSRLANGGKEYLVAVNCSPEKELTLKIALASGTKRVRTDGTLVDAALYTNEYWIEPDVAEVFQAP